MNITAFIQALGPMEIGIIVFLFLLLFGAKKLPQLARGIGESIRELRKGAKDLGDDIARDSEEDPDAK